MTPSDLAGERSWTALALTRASLFYTGLTLWITMTVNSVWRGVRSDVLELVLEVIVYVHPTLC